MADEEVERLRIQIAEEKLAELRADRKDILEDMDNAETPEDRAFAEQQLEGIDKAIAEQAERVGLHTIEARKRSRRTDPDMPGRLF
ncbi:hypothetical protein [Nocardia sp. IFM 10818]